MLTITAPGTSSDKQPLEACVYRPGDMPSAWEFLEPFLERSVELSHGLLSMKVFRERLLDGSLVAFATFRGMTVELVLTVEKVEYPSYTAIRIFSISGSNLKEAAKFVDALEAWALMQGAVEIEGWCRPAMTRLARHFGWTPKMTIVSKDLRRRLQ